LLLAAIVVLALLLRSGAHSTAPNGWREDELSNALVISQHVREGDIRLYYDNASGHEGLYHWLQAGSMALFGPSVAGVRGVSILMGTLGVLFTYLLTRHMFDWSTAAIAAVLLSVSFWSLMYSRSGQRHITVTVTTLLSFWFLWRALPAQSEGDQEQPSGLRDFVLAGIFLGIGFYTYFASRGIPLILIVLGVYLFLWKRELWRASWRGLVVTFAIALVLAVPLVITLRQQPQAEERVGELAQPITDATNGNFTTMAQYATITLSMFTHDGDSEVLYNVPYRPVFGALGAGLFWIGVTLAMIRAFGPARDPRMAFLLAWLGAGLAPGALSVPAASLGHTILAQPAAMIFPALAITQGGRWLAQQQAGRRYAARAVLAVTVSFLGWESVRGIVDYFVMWPADSFNRVLHHSDLHEAAAWLNDHPENKNIAIGGYLVERWDQQVLHLDLHGDGWQIRAYDPRQAQLYMLGGGVVVIPAYLDHTWGTVSLGSTLQSDVPYALRADSPPVESDSASPLAAFDDGLTLLAVELHQGADRLEAITTWRAESILDLPPFPLLSKPPALGEVDTPRLAIFVQLLDATNQRVSGADGLGVDPYTLRPGDEFRQRMEIPLDQVKPGDYAFVIGLYNPASGERHTIRETGDDLLIVEIVSIP
jgi:hypothetical protein